MLKYLKLCTHPRWYGCCCPFPFTKTHTVECVCALNNDVHIDGNNDDGSPSETLPLTTSNETYLFKKHWWTLEQWCLEDDHLPPAVISNNISERNCEQLFVGCVCVCGENGWLRNRTSRRLMATHGGIKINRCMRRMWCFISAVYLRWRFMYKKIEKFLIIESRHIRIVTCRLCDHRRLCVLVHWTLEVLLGN